MSNYEITIGTSSSIYPVIIEVSAISKDEAEKQVSEFINFSSEIDTVEIY